MNKRSLFANKSSSHDSIKATKNNLCHQKTSPKSGIVNEEVAFNRALSQILRAKFEREFPNKMRENGAAVGGVSRSTFDRWISGETDIPASKLYRFTKEQLISMDCIETAMERLDPRQRSLF